MYIIDYIVEMSKLKKSTIVTMNLLLIVVSIFFLSIVQLPENKFIAVIIVILAFASLIYLLLTSVLVFVDLLTWLENKQRERVMSRYFKTIKYKHINNFDFQSERFACDSHILGNWCRVYINEHSTDAFFTIDKKGVHYSKAFDLLDNNVKSKILELFEEDLLKAHVEYNEWREKQKAGEMEKFQRQAEKVKRIVGVK